MNPNLKRKTLMIAVIADDFTGAAEIAGLALTFGYNVAIITSFKSIPQSEIIVVATDLRSRKPENAAKESERITLELLKLNPEFIYKKIDSLLRGNVGVELQAQMKVTNTNRSLIIPANPLLNRTIKDGIYYLDDKPIMESAFSKDKSFKNKSSNCVEILQTEGVDQVYNISCTDRLPKSGLIIGNTKDQNDLSCWVHKIHGDTVISGASGFFGEILRDRRPNQQSYNASSLIETSKSIFICGCNFPLSKTMVFDAERNGACVAKMPDEIYFSKKVNTLLIDKWVEEIISMFDGNNRVIVSVLQKPTSQSISSVKLKETLGMVIKKVSNRITINEILIEGGSTAQFLLKALSFSTFFPIQAIAPGVTRMKIGEKEGVAVTLKPGSYEWPKTIWKFD